MQLQDAVRLIQNTNINSKTKSIWADLGCGSGLFTNALASLLKDGSRVYAIDKNISSFKKNDSVNTVDLEPIKLDFEKTTLPFENLDGMIMANSLHYVKDKIMLIEKLKKNLNKNGHFLIVEYDMEIPNHWVPYPIGFLSLKKLFYDAGFSSVTKVNERPSAFNRGNLYSVMIKN